MAIGYSTSLSSTIDAEPNLQTGVGDAEVDSTTSTEDEFCSQFTFVVYVIVFGALCTFGLVGNFLSFAVLGWERRDRGRVATYLLQTMAVVDNLFLLAAGVSQMSMALKLYTLQDLSDAVNPSDINMTAQSYPPLSHSSVVVHDNVSSASPRGCGSEWSFDTDHSSVGALRDVAGYRVVVADEFHDVTPALVIPPMMNKSSTPIDNGSRDNMFAIFIVNISAYAAVIVFPLVHVTQMWTVWITVLVAVNRYVAICRPFQVSQVCTMKQTTRQIAALGVAIFVYCLPRFFEYQLVYEPAPYFGNRVIPREIETELKGNLIYNIVYENLLYCLFVFLGPLVLIAVLNAWLVIELIRARRRRSSQQLSLHTGRGGTCTLRMTVNGGSGCGTSSHGGTSGEHNLTLVMIVIVLIFVVCQTPAFVNQILFSLIGYEEYSCGKVYFYYFHVSNIVVSANSSVNFVVYCVFRRQFRHRLQACCRGQKDDNRLRYSYQLTANGQRQGLENIFMASTRPPSHGIDDAMHYPLRVVVPTVNWESEVEQVSASPPLSPFNDGGSRDGD